MTDYTLFSQGNVGISKFYTNGVTYNLAIEFYVSQPAYFKGWLIYRPDTSMPPPQTCYLWRVSDQAQLYSQNVSPGSATGWLSFTCATGFVLLTPYTRYRASYYLPSSYYFDTFPVVQYYFSTGVGSAGVSSGPLTAPNTVQSTNQQQGSFSNGGYPNQASNAGGDLYGLDITVTTPDATSGSPVLGLGSSGALVWRASSQLMLGSNGVSGKSVQRSASSTISLYSSSSIFSSATLAATSTMGLTSSGTASSRHSPQATSTLSLGTSAVSHKATAVAATSVLSLQAPTISDFCAFLANQVADALIVNNWTPANYLAEVAGGASEALAADVWGGLLLLARGDRSRAQQVVRHLRRYRIKGAAVTGNHYLGPTGVLGYEPYASIGHPGPPAVIDQAGTWVATLFKQRYGEPTGDDVASLLTWNTTAESASTRRVGALGWLGFFEDGDPVGLLARQVIPASAMTAGAQWLAYSATIAGLAARPSTAVAALAVLVATGSHALCRPDPLPAPLVIGLGMVRSVDPLGRYVFTFTWASDAAVPVAGFEALPQTSPDGIVWSPIAPTVLSGSVETVRTGTSSYQGAWSVPAPGSAMSYRVQVRMRNATFGPWAISPVVAVTS